MPNRRKHVSSWPGKIAASLAVTLLALNPAVAQAEGEEPGVPRTIIGLTDVQGLNIFHSDFKAPGPVLLPPGLPPVTTLQVPSEGTFEERMQAAEPVFGHLSRGVLYHVAGTRLLLFQGGTGEYSILPTGGHGTATSSSAIGLEHGTSPNSLLLYFTYSSGNPAPTFDWLVEQHWIDLFSSSIAGIGVTDHCPEARFVRQFAQQGRPWFTYAGNQGQGSAEYFLTPGMPEAYRVGGVDENGRTYYGHLRDNDPYTLTDTPTRPYETGDFFYRQFASFNSLDQHSWGGGTSFATPATAGRAANLLHSARELLGSEWNGVREGKLAIAAPAATIPATGPLADGDFTREELFDLLHHVAIPAEPSSPGRYLLEGYGALNDQAMARAERVLEGLEPEPARAEEDAAHEAVDSALAPLYEEDSCKPDPPCPPICINRAAISGLRARIPFR